MEQPVLPRSLTRMTLVYNEVDNERMRAHHKYGAMCSVETWEPLDAWWLPTLTEELGEVARVLSELRRNSYDNTSTALRDARVGLIQLAAVACAWVDSIDDTI